MRSDRTLRPEPCRRGLLKALGCVLATPAATLARASSPERIASLDYGAATTLLALGLPPVAVADAADWDVWVVDPALPAGIVDLGDDLEPNMELLAAIRPELILLTPYLAPLAPTLERIAPVMTLTIYAEDGRPLARAEAQTLELAARIGRIDAARAFLAEADATFAALRARLAGIAVPPLALVNFMDARHARVFGRHGLYQDVLDRLGLVNAWSGPTNFWGFRTIGIEELSRVPDAAALVAFEPVPPAILPTLRASPLWRALPFVRENRVSTLPGVLMFGMVPSALRFARLLTEHLTRRA
ncbi:ABC transporter substrate-binding protein [Salinarimonas sp.]|uniref:ABC transporter substrate-binding protein n=1 Tax=Salinarimonas sp. TaxID=2766526 RepID=UPI0032D95618